MLECQFQGKITKKAVYLKSGIWNSKMLPIPTGPFLSFSPPQLPDKVCSQANSGVPCFIDIVFHIHSLSIPGNVIPVFQGLSLSYSRESLVPMFHILSLKYSMFYHISIPCFMA